VHGAGKEKRCFCLAALRRCSVLDRMYGFIGRPTIEDYDDDLLAYVHMI